MANYLSNSITEYMLDTLTQSNSVKEHVQQVNKSNESVSWVLIGTNPSKLDVCRVLIMQVIQIGNVWGDLLALLAEDRIIYCFVKFECRNIKGVFQRFLIHWIGAKVTIEDINLCKSHIDKIKSVIGISVNVIYPRDRKNLFNEIESRLTSFQNDVDKTLIIDSPKPSENNNVILEFNAGEKKKIEQIAPTNLQPRYTVNFKMCIIGESAVGKSCILKSFQSGGRGLNTSEIPISTVGFDYAFHKFNIPNTDTTCRVKIWDTGGQERFRSMAVMSFRNSHVVVMVYDISDFESFNAIPNWYAKTKEYVDDRAIYMLVGNKLDLHERREVPQRTAQNYAKENGFEYFECSTTQGSNIFHLFNQIEKSIQHIYPDKLVHRDTSILQESNCVVLDAGSSGASENSGCCLTSWWRRRSSSTD